MSVNNIMLTNNNNINYSYYPTAGGTITLNTIYNFLVSNSLNCTNIRKITITLSTSFTLEKYLFSPNNILNNNNNKKFSNLQTVYLKINKLSDYCFYNLTSLQNVYFINTITTINDFCFNGCVNLINFYRDINSNIYNFNNVTHIGTYALAYTNFSTLTIPSTVNFIGNYCFTGMPNLTQIFFEDNLLNNITIGNNIIDTNKTVTIYLNMTKDYLFSLKDANNTNHIYSYYKFISAT